MHSEDFDSASIKEAAADWFVRRRDGLSPEAETAYQAWARADPRHEAAMAELRATWEAVSFPAGAGRGQEAAGVLDQWAAARRRSYVLATAGLAVAAALVFAFLPLGSPTKVVRPAAAVAVRPNITTLSDGSTVELNKDAEIASDFTRTRRSVRLIRGEAFFSVTKDATRPFVVSAGGVEVRAVGTAFAVRSGTDGVGVLVTEGRVAVASAAPSVPQDVRAGEPLPPPQPVYLDAGRSVALTHERFSDTPPPVKPVSAEEIGASLAWRGERLESSRMPLSDVAILFNQRNRVQLSISDRAAASIPISGIFWADDPEGFARLLESGLAVRTRRAENIIFLTSR